MYAYSESWRLGDFVRCNWARISWDDCLIHSIAYIHDIYIVFFFAFSKEQLTITCVTVTNGVIMKLRNLVRVSWIIIWKLKFILDSWDIIVIILTSATSIMYIYKLMKHRIPQTRPTFILVYAHVHFIHKYSMSLYRWILPHEENLI